MLALFKILLVNPLFAYFVRRISGANKFTGMKHVGFSFFTMFDRRKIIALLLYDDFKHSPSVPIPSRPPCPRKRPSKKKFGRLQ